MEALSSVTHVTVGFRFERTFRLPDISGQMVDDILSDAKSPFRKEEFNLFTNVQETNAWEKLLYNKKDELINDYLRINTDDIIFSMSVKDTFKDAFDCIKERFLPYFENCLFKKFSITKIKRLGIVYTFKLSDRKQVEQILEKISATTNNNTIDQYTISFSHKLPNEGALISKDVNNYGNVIYTFQEIKGNLIMVVDYQKYFSPIIEDLRDCDADKFYDNSLSLLKKKLEKMK